LDKKIVCFGDSNTYGYNPENGERYSCGELWTTIMEQELGDRSRVINEGYNSRTTDMDEAGSSLVNGFKALADTLNRNIPIELLIIMLGSNDLKEYFHRTPEEIAQAAGRIVIAAGNIMRAAEENQRAKILLVSPIHIGADIRVSPFGEQFGYENAIKKSYQFAYLYQKEAKYCGAAFFDAAQITEPGKIDSLHLSREGHRLLGLALAKKAGELLKME
jgi:lysophospholipase L1-like esterase